MTADRPEPRLEDGPLLTGAGRFTGDVRFEREAALVVQRELDGRTPYRFFAGIARA